MRVFLLTALLMLVSGVGSPSLRAELNPLLETSSRYDRVEVTAVASPDTLVVAGRERVVLIGVAGLRLPPPADERRDEHGFPIRGPEDPAVPVAVEAVRHVRDLVLGQTVRLEFDAERRNEAGELEAYVFLPDGRLLNEELLKQGFVLLKLRSPNLRYADRLRAASREAREAMRGLQADW